MDIKELTAKTDKATERQVSLKGEVPAEPKKNSRLKPFLRVGVKNRLIRRVRSWRTEKEKLAHKDVLPSDEKIGWRKWLFGCTGDGTVETANRGAPPKTKTNSNKRRLI